ncbi:MAG: hypothetical protein IMX01_10375 [Limnochordaceae bacterium]|nr:hypothetical protein [Limnochordaceae bacterium]
MRKMFTAILCGLSIVTVAGSALAANEPVRIVRGTAVLDGKLDDFVAAGAEVCKIYPPDFSGKTQGPSSPEDQSAVVYAMYDDDYFYIGANVTDDKLVMERSGGSIWENDEVGFWLAGYQFGIAVDKETGKPFVQDWMNSGARSEASVVQTATGWIAEAKLSLADLRAKGVVIEKGKSVQFAVTTDDCDTPGGGWEGNLQFPTSWTWNQPATFATATFEEG